MNLCSRSGQYGEGYFRSRIMMSNLQMLSIIVEQSCHSNPFDLTCLLMKFNKVKWISYKRDNGRGVLDDYIKHLMTAQS